MSAHRVPSSQSPIPSGAKGRRRRRRFAATLAGAALAVGGLAACGSDDAAGSDGQVTVSDGWSREPAEGQTRTAAYGVVTNLSDEDVTIVSAASDVSDTVELHETVMDGDTMQMRERDGGFVVPAGGTFTFEPGGPHVMMFDVDPASYPDMVEVTLTLDDGSTLDFSAEVRSLDATSGDMDHSDMDG